MTKQVSLEKGRAAMRAARYVEALRHFQAAIDLASDDPAAWYERAAALEAVERFPEAIESLRRAQSLDPEGYGAIALFSMDNCCVGLGDLPRAIEFFDQALAVNPSLKRAWHNRAMALVDLDRVKEAASSFAKAAELSPSDAHTALWQGYCLQQLGLPRDAERCFSRATGSNATHDVAQVWMQIGAHLHTRNALEPALDAYDRALAVLPDWGVAWERRGVCLAQLGNRDEDALAAFDRVIALEGPSKLSACANKAALLMRQGRKRAGTAIYQRVLDLPPGSALDHQARAQALRALGRHAEALESFDLANRLDPNADNLFGKALALERVGRPADAAAVLRHIVRTVPRHADAWLRLARCLLVTSDLNEAIVCTEKAAILGPAPAELWFLQGVALLRMERYDDAVAPLEKSVAAQPDGDGAWLNLGQCLQKLERHTDAVRAFDQVLRLDPTSIVALRGKALSLGALGKSAEADSCAATGLAIDLLKKGDGECVARARQAIALDPGNWLATRLLADVMLQIDEPEEASVLLARVLELRPDDAVGWTTRGTILGKLGRMEEAGACFRHALEADPKSPMALRNWANYLVDTGDPEEALEVYGRSLEADPDNGNAWHGKGACLARLDRVPEAVEAFQQAVAIAPDDAEAWNDLATCLTHLTRDKEAAEAWRRAQALDPSLEPSPEPGRPSSSDATTAYAHLGRGDHAAAVDAFDAALALDPGRTDLWVDRGVCAEIVEGPARAIDCFDRALALDPEAIGAWYNRGVSLRNLERMEEAIAAFEKVVKLHRAQDLPPDPDLLHAYHNMASCQMLLDRREEALDGLDEVVRLAREAPERWREEVQRAEHLKGVLFSLPQ